MVEMYEWKILKETQSYGIPGWEKPREGAFGGSGAFSTQMAFPPDWRFTGVRSPNPTPTAPHRMDLDDGQTGSIGAWAQWKENRRMREAFRQQQEHIRQLALTGKPLPPGFVGPGLGDKSAADLKRKVGDPYVLYTDKGPMPIGPGGTRGPKRDRIGDFIEQAGRKLLPVLHGPTRRASQALHWKNMADKNALNMWLDRSDHGRKTYIAPPEDQRTIARMLIRAGFDRKDIKGLLAQGPKYMETLNALGRKRAAKAGLGPEDEDAASDGGPVEEEVVDDTSSSDTVTTLDHLKTGERKIREGYYDSMTPEEWQSVMAEHSDDMSEVADDPEHKNYDQVMEILEAYDKVRDQVPLPEFDHEKYGEGTDYPTCPDCGHPPHDTEWCDKCDPDAYKRFHQDFGGLDEEDIAANQEWWDENVKPENLRFFGHLADSEAGQEKIGKIIAMARKYWDENPQRGIFPDYSQDPIEWITTHLSYDHGNWDHSAQKALKDIVDQYQNPNTESNRKHKSGPNKGKKMSAEDLKDEAKAWLSLWMKMLGGPHAEFDRFGEGAIMGDVEGFTDEETDPDDSLFADSFDDPFQDAWSILKAR